MASSIEEVWAEYVSLLRAHVPGAVANLAAGAAETALTDLERVIEQSLPQDVRTLLRLNDGQVRLGRPYVFPGLQFLSCRGIADEWLAWARFREGETEDGLGILDNHAAALEPGVRDVYTHPGWLPLLKRGDRADYVGIDMAPAEGGRVGQIINFGRDEDQHSIAFEGLQGLLEFWVAQLRSSSKGSNVKLDKLDGLAMLRHAAVKRRQHYG